MQSLIKMALLLSWIIYISTSLWWTLDAGNWEGHMLTSGNESASNSENDFNELVKLDFLLNSRDRFRMIIFLEILISIKFF